MKFESFEAIFIIYQFGYLFKNEGVELRLRSVYFNLGFQFINLFLILLVFDLKNGKLLALLIQHILQLIESLRIYLVRICVIHILSILRPNLLLLLQSVLKVTILFFLKVHLRIDQEKLTNISANQLIQWLETLITYLQLLLSVLVEGFRIYWAFFAKITLWFLCLIHKYI